MNESVLITGGAGFVGSHLAEALLAAGHEVTVFDNLEPQVHGNGCSEWPAYLRSSLKRVRGDVQDADALAEPLREAEVVFHLAAMVGVGQSMYQIRRYTEANTLGAANLLQLLAENAGRVRKLVVASSMSIYGEGAYECPNCGPIAPRLRDEAQLMERDWEVHCECCQAELRPLPTPEDKPLFPSSIYAIGKRDHEEMFLTFGRAYRVPAVGLRFFNIYGSRQALSNPYTGVAAIFCARMLQGQPPVIFEDGEQRRDFVHVSDVVQACTLAMDSPAADHQVFNVGSGQPVGISTVAQILARELGWEGRFEVTGKYRAGDIRHCYADISRIQQLLGYGPRVRFEEGARELVDWVARQQVVREPVADATSELMARGLVR